MVTTARGAQNGAHPGPPRSLPDLDPTGPFLEAAGLVLDEVTGSRVTAHIELGSHHHTPWGVVHGGVYTTAIESAASVGACKAVLDKAMYAVGVNNNTDFLSPMREGRVDVLAECITIGRVQQLWQVTITNAATGKIVARGSVRLQNLPLDASRPAGG